jgi:hypothetical protein
MNKYERLKELEAKKKRYEEFFEQSRGYDYVVIAKNPHKRLPFFEQKQNTKRVSGIAQIMDIPDLGFMEYIKSLIEEDYKAVCKEFAELQKDL